MAAAYSVRFGIASSGVADYVVPADKRAVLKCVACENANASPGWWVLYVAGTRVYKQPIIASSGQALVNLHVVAYAGETLSLSTTAQMVAVMSGYLLAA